MNRLVRNLQVMICHGAITLQAAQDAIRTNWIRALKRIVTGEDLTREIEPVE